MSASIAKLETQRQDKDVKETENVTENKQSQENNESISNRPLPMGRTFLRELLAESVLGLIFWSVFQELVPSISLNIVKQQQPLYFIICAVWLSPLLLSSPTVLRYSQSPSGLLLLRLIMVASLASLQTPSPDLRVALLVAGNFAAVLLLGSTWWHKSCHQRSVSFWGLFLGYIALITLKIWYVSINPVWASQTSNSVFIAVGILAALDRFGAVEYPYPQFKANTAITEHWVLMACGFGSLLFLTQWLFGDVALLSRWSIQGYPSSGPHPFPAGVAVFIELISGVLLCPKRDLVTNFLWIWFVGGHMTVGVYYLSGFLGFACGLILAPFIMSTWPEFADRVTSCPPAPTLTLAMAVYTAETYFSIATVYASLPYGFLFNGRAIFLLIPVVLFIGRALLKGPTRDPTLPGSTNIAFSNLDGTGCYQLFADAKIFIILLLLIGMGGYARLHSTHEVQQPKQSGLPTITGLIWNSQYLMDNNGVLSHERVANLLHQSDADIIALVESDSSRLCMGNRDSSLWLGMKLGMYDDFGPATKLHTTGVSLLTRYPIVSTEHHLLNSSEGPAVPALIATLNISGHYLNVVAAHFPEMRFVVDRKFQAEFISNFTRRSQYPVLFLASLSAKPGNQDYRRLETFGKLKDIDSSDKERFTKSIMYKNLIRLGFARISQSYLSDDEVQIAKFQFTSVKNFKDNPEVTIDESRVDDSILFPKSFGSYLEGAYKGSKHHYQMGTPKYFIAPSQ